jgi:hypothetical protein
MRVIAIFPFIQKPAIRPNFGWPENLTPGPQNDAHRFVVENQRKGSHAGLLGKRPATAAQL